MLLGQHFGADLDDFVGEAEAFVAHGLALVAVVAHGDVHRGVAIVHQGQQLAVALRHCFLVVLDVGMGAALGLHGEQGVQQNQHTCPEEVSCRLHILAAAVAFQVAILFAVVFKRLLGVVDVALGFFYGVSLFHGWCRLCSLWLPCLRNLAELVRSQ